MEAGAPPEAVRALDWFFEAYYARRPVNATFIGVHDGDGAWPDCSENGLGDWLSENRALAGILATHAASPSGDLDLDWDLQVAGGFLETQVWELASSHGPAGNPAFYTGEAAFGIISLLLTDFAPLGDRVASLTDRLYGLPRFLAQGENRLEAAPRAWTQRARRECGALLALLERGLVTAAESWTPETVTQKGRTALEEARSHGLAAARRFSTFLEGIPDAGEGAASAGPQALSLHLEGGHFVSDSLDGLLRMAEDELRWAQEAVEATPEPQEAEPVAVEATPEPQEAEPVAVEAPGQHRYQAAWDAVREEVEGLDLLTWPDFPIEYVPRPTWVREAAEDLYFLYYRAPSAFCRPAVHHYLIHPSEVLDDATIRLNHVIHHGSVGHHVQNWHAYRARSRVGRIAAVDCSARTAMLAGGTMAEGWACYATDLMKEVGFLTPAEEYKELRGRVRMCARAVVDLRLHSGVMTLSQAATFYQSVAGMSAAAARAEAVKNSMFPGGAVMYLLGRDGIHRLRERIMALEGGGFSLRRFHDRFLSHGSVPVSLIAQRMTDDAMSELHPVRPVKEA
ncbi:MAG: DUF885 domain-containing protein [Gemmatimonadota bacterium]|nr:DUF885 domain-containing protein [Gemmatimonadota bacterium]